MDEGNMNQSISTNEVDKVLRKLRNNKSVGIDNLPCEVLKTHESSLLIKELFNKIFQSHIILSLWKKLSLNLFQRVLPQTHDYYYNTEVLLFYQHHIKFTLA